MDEKIKLQVPSEVPEGFPEYVEQGYLSTELPRGEVIEVADRRFADWLVRELGLVEVDVPTSEASSEAGGSPAFPADAFPDDFPRREIFTGQELSLGDLRGKSREDLIALPGVGEKTAEMILEYFAGEENSDGGAE